MWTSRFRCIDLENCGSFAEDAVEPNQFVFKPKLKDEDSDYRSQMARNIARWNLSGAIEKKESRKPLDCSVCSGPASYRCQTCSLLRDFCKECLMADHNQIWGHHIQKFDIKTGWESDHVAICCELLCDNPNCQKTAPIRTELIGSGWEEVRFISTCACKPVWEHLADKGFVSNHSGKRAFDMTTLELVLQLNNAGVPLNMACESIQSMLNLPSNIYNDLTDCFYQYRAQKLKLISNRRGLQTGARQVRYASQ